MLNLIYDRTQSDADRAEYLDGVDWDDMTDSEKLEYVSELKGGYDYRALNRVVAAMRYLSEVLTSYGYYAPVGTSPAWAKGDTQTAAQMEQFATDVKTLRAALTLVAEAPAAPYSVRFLTWQKANDIERILTIVEDALGRLPAAFRHCGTFYSGQGGLRT